MILVTSSLPQEGKTTISINSAIVLAQRNNRVLLLDADLRRPGVARAFGMNATRGLSTVLAAGHEPNSAIIAVPDMPNLSVLPAGPIPPHPAELLDSRRMGELIDLWSSEYDHIIIDTPPVLSVTDPVLMSSRADAVVLVIRAGKTTKHALRRTRELLMQVNAPVKGVVVNGVDGHSGDSYYYYYYYYGAKYGSRYYNTESASDVNVAGAQVGTLTSRGNSSTRITIAGRDGCCLLAFACWQSAPTDLAQFACT